MHGPLIVHYQTMEILIGLTACLVSLLTFFSGFGLGTILLPLFGVYFELPVAVLLTALVHLCNNLFKLMLVIRNIHVNTLFKFLAYAVPAGILGAYLLRIFDTRFILSSYALCGKLFHIKPVNLTLGLLMVLFGIWELVPRLSALSLPAKWFPLGAMFSGFFGGLSGHQGAFRSVVLRRSGLTKEAFIATGVAIACVIDVVRIPFYWPQAHVLNTANWLSHFLAALTGALLGAFIGNRWLKKTSLQLLHWVLGCTLAVFGMLYALGIMA
jgi:uncharacterized membrane protein YfcA